MGIREKAAVEEWFDIGMPFHIMRDHPYHGMALLAGMWGIAKHGKPLLKLDGNVRNEVRLRDGVSLRIPH